MQINRIIIDYRFQSAHSSPDNDETTEEMARHFGEYVYLFIYIL